MCTCQSLAVLWESVQVKTKESGKKTTIYVVFIMDASLYSGKPFRICKRYSRLCLNRENTINISFYKINNKTVKMRILFKMTAFKEHWAILCHNPRYLNNVSIIENGFVFPFNSDVYAAFCAFLLLLAANQDENRRPAAT